MSFRERVLRTLSYAWAKGTPREAAPPAECIACGSSAFGALPLCDACTEQWLDDGDALVALRPAAGASGAALGPLGGLLPRDAMTPGLVEAARGARPLLRLSGPRARHVADRLARRGADAFVLPEKAAYRLVPVVPVWAAVLVVGAATAGAAVLVSPWLTLLGAAAGAGIVVPALRKARAPALVRSAPRTALPGDAEAAIGSAFDRLPPGELRKLAVEVAFEGRRLSLRAPAGDRDLMLPPTGTLVRAACEALLEAARRMGGTMAREDGPLAHPEAAAAREGELSALAEAACDALDALRAAAPGPFIPDARAVERLDRTAAQVEAVLRAPTGSHSWIGRRSGEPLG